MYCNIPIKTPEEDKVYCTSLCEKRKQITDERIPKEQTSGMIKVKLKINEFQCNHCGDVSIHLYRSKKDPTKRLKRTISTILEPTLNWEKDDKSYKSRNVVFTEGLAEIDNKIYLYYGSIDIYICLAMSNN